MKKNPKPYDKNIYLDVQRTHQNEEEIAFINYVELFLEDSNIDEAVEYALEFELWVFEYINIQDKNIFNIYLGKSSPTQDYWVYLSKIFKKTEILMGKDIPGEFYKVLFNEDDEYNFPPLLTNLNIGDIINNYEPFLDSALRKNQLINIYVICLIYWSYRFYEFGENEEHLLQFCNYLLDFIKNKLEDHSESELEDNTLEKIINGDRKSLRHVSFAERLSELVFEYFKNKSRIKDAVISKININLKDLRFLLIAKSSPRLVNEIEEIKTLIRRII